MCPGNIFFHEASSGKQRMLAIARQTFSANRWHRQHVNYGREYWKKFAHRLPPLARARCLEFYQLDPSDCEHSPAVAVSEDASPARSPMASTLEEDLRVPSLSFLSDTEESLKDGNPLLLTPTSVPSECSTDLSPSTDWIDHLLGDEDEPVVSGELPCNSTPEWTSQQQARESTRQILGDETTWEGIILIVEAVELSAEGLELEKTLDDSKAQARRVSTASVQRFRERVGPRWRVITLYRDAWFQAHRARYASSCLCLDYNDPALGFHLKKAGVSQPVRHVLLNPVGASASVLASRYPSPLEIFGWAEGSGTRTVWMPDHADITQLLRARNHRAELCQGNRVGGEDLMTVWASCQTAAEPRHRCSGWEAFPLSVGIMWNGTKIDRTKTQWLLNLHLEEWCKERTLPHSLRWSGYRDQVGVEVSDVPAGVSVHEPQAQRPEVLGASHASPKCESDGYQALVDADNAESRDIGIKTDVQLIRRLLLTQQQQHLKAVPDRKLTEHYSLCQSRGVPVSRRKGGKGGLYMNRVVKAGTTLLVPIGKERAKPQQKPVLPQLLLQNGRWFAVSSTMWDVGLITSQTTILEERHAHLMPFLHLTSDREAANCEISYSDTGQPLVVASRDLVEGEWVVLYLGAINTPVADVAPAPPESTPVDMEELLEVRMHGYGHVQPPIQGKDKTDDKWIWWEAEADADAASDSLADENAQSEDTPVIPPPPKVPNLGLGTVNLNGKWQNKNIPGLIKDAVDHPTKGIDGLMFVDPRIPASKVTEFTRNLTRALEGRSVFIHVCPARPPLDKPNSTARADLVGGVIVVVFCKPGLDVLTVTQDEGGFGALTRVHLGVGKQTVLWLGAYVPYPTKKAASSLRRKMGEYHKKYRLPSHPEEEEFWDKNGEFDGMGYTWRLISNAVARSMDNSRHIGVILTGDFNQSLYDPDDTIKLQERADALGLYTSLAAHFRRIGCEYPTHNFNTPKPGKHLDTMFTNLPGDTLVEGGSPTGWEWISLTDHLLVICRFFLAEMSQTKRVRLPTQPEPITFDLSKKAAKKRIQDHFQHLTREARDELQGSALESAEETGRRLEYTCRKWVELAKVVHKDEYGVKSGYRYKRSQEHNGIRVHLKYLTLMHKVVCGYRGGSRTGAPAQVKGRWRALRRELHKWKKEEDRVWRFSKDRPTTLDYGTGHSREWWSIAGLHDNPGITISQDMCILRRRLQGVMSREQKADIKRAIQRRDQRAAEGRLKQVVQSTLNLRLPTPMFRQVYHENRWITDPAEVHDFYTQGWERRFLLPEDSLPAQAGLEPSDGDGTLSEIDQWELMLTDPQAFVNTYERIDNLRIPTPLVRDIAEAFANNPHRAELERYLRKAFDGDFTLDEMVKLVRKSKSTTPGLTGLSYQMLKLLPDECLQDLFHMLNMLWRDRSIPDFWKFKTLQALPKSDKANPGVNDLRPIGLIEVTRKLWTRMVMSRIFSGLKEFQTLQANQCGGLANKGTDSALMQLLHLLEDGVQTDVEPGLGEPAPQIDFTSWDTKMAYDSVGNHVQYAAWRRLGVPRREVEWLMGLDLFGIFVVLTPYSRAQLHKVTMPSMYNCQHHSTVRAMGFTPQRGLTQGDVKSPLGWIAYFDILISALNRCRKDEYPKVKVEVPLLTSVLPSVYMDDLTTATCQRDHTQALADLVSAMNALFGTEAAVEKFRAISTHPSTHGEELIIHDWQWRERRRAFKGPGHVIRILGVKINLGGTWDEQVEELTDKFDKLGNILNASKANEATKIKVINVAIVLKATYGLGLSAWPEESLKKLDGVLSRMAKRALRLPISFPTELIHSKRFGFGVIRLAEHVVQTKVRCLNRCLEGPGQQSVHARGLINSAMVDHLGCNIQGGVDAVGVAPKRNRYVSDIFRAGELHQQRWQRVGPTPEQALTQLGCVAGILEWPAELLKHITDFDHHFLAELCNWDTGKPADWLTPPAPYSPLLEATDMQSLNKLLDQTALPNAIPIRSGHILEFDEGSFKRYFEVNGYLQDENRLGGFWYRQGVDPYDDEENWGVVLEREEGSFDQGACGSGRCDLTYIENRKPGLAFRMLQRVRLEGEVDYTGPPFRRVMGTNYSIRWDVRPYQLAPRHRPGIAEWTRQVLAAARVTNRNIDCLTSDASVVPKEIHSADIWDGPQEHLVKQGAIVLTDNAWKEGKAAHGEELGPVGVVIVEGVPTQIKDAHGAELVQLIGSLEIAHAEATLEERSRPPTISSDCKSLLERGRLEKSRFGTRSLDNRHYGFAFRLYRRLRWVWRDWLLQWVRSHPERHKGIAEYVSPDARIMLADKFAGTRDVEDTLDELEGRQWRYSRYGLLPEFIHRVQAKDILKGIFSHGDFCWIDETGCPTMQTLFAGEKPDRVHKYLSEREEYAKTGSGYKWNDSVVGLLAHWRKKTKVVNNRWKRRAEILNTWDKRNNGRNLQKILKLPTAPTCPLCVLTADTQAHLMLRCSHPVLSVAREGFKKKVMQRIASELTGPGRVYLEGKWLWVFEPSEGSCSIPEEMARMGFVTGRPLRSTLWHDTDSHLLSKHERGQLTKCVLDLLDMSTIYLRQMESLKQSISSAPDPIQKRLRTSTANVGDVRGLLQRPYSRKGQWARAKVWKSSIAGFYMHARESPLGQGPVVEVPTNITDTVSVQTSPDMGKEVQTETVWQSDWLRWKPPSAKTSRGRRASKRQPRKIVSRDKSPGSNPVASTTPEQERHMTETGNRGPEHTPTVEGRGLLPLVSGVCPSIPEWALPFPQMRLPGRNGCNMSGTENRDE